MEKMVVLAHGKINLTLDVLSRRSDGYHNLRSVMQSITLADKLEFTKMAKGIEVETSFSFVPATDNLVYKAAQLFLDTLGLNQGVKIKLTKQIPIAAGLAGGSADAAAVLWALNKLYDTDLSLPELQKLGRMLGADIPFCLQGGAQLAEGIGDLLTPLPSISPYYIVLINPRYSVSTKAVYQSLRPEMFGDHYTAHLIKALQNNADLSPHVGNCFEPITSALVPEINTWKERLLDAHASLSLMSGSGPTVFGFFESQETAQAFVRKWYNECWMTVTTPSRSGLSELNKGGTK